MYGGGAINLGTQCGTPGAPPPPLCFDYTPFYVSVSGRDNPYAPEWTMSAGIEYPLASKSGINITPRIDYSYQGSQWTTMLQNFPQDYLPGHGILNTRITFSRGSYSVVGYVNNVLNNTYVSGQFINTEFLGPPREFGIRLKYSF